MPPPTLNYEEPLVALPDVRRCVWVALLDVRRCVWRRWCSGRLRARPPARSPHALLSLGVVDLEARPCPPDPPAPSTTVAYAVLRLPSNVARNSLAVIS